MEVCLRLCVSRTSIPLHVLACLTLTAAISTQVHSNSIVWLQIIQDHGQFDSAPIASFLHALGMGDFSTSFSEAEVDLESLQLLDEADLTDLGVSNPTDRQKLLHGVEELRATLSG